MLFMLQKIARDRRIVALFAFAGVILLANYPLVGHIRTHIIGRDSEDAFEVLWQLSWMKTAVFLQHHYPFYTPNIFYPNGWYLASGAQPTWYLFLLAPATQLLGVVTTYNLTLLMTFIVAGFGLYLFAYQLTRQSLPSFLAGCVYIFAPILTLRLGGHLHTLFSMMFLPYTTLCFYFALHREARKWHWIIAAAMTLALTILGMWYFLFIASLPLAVFAIFRPKMIGWRETILRLIFIGSITLLCIAPFAYLTWQARQAMFPESGDFSIASSDGYSMSPDYLLAPNANHPLWGAWSKEKFVVQGEQHFVSVGYAALILAIIGLRVTPWEKNRPIVLMALTSLIFGMGLTLHWHNSRVLLSVPTGTADFFKPLFGDISLLPNQIAIPLPSLFLYHLVPFFAAMRVWARFDVPFMLAIGILAGHGSAFLCKSGEKWRQFIVLLLLGIVIFEGVIAPYGNFTDVSKNDRSANQWLARQPLGTTLIEYPRPWVNTIAMYSQSLHGQSLVNGYISVEPTHLQNVSERLGIWPQADALPILREWGVQYVVVSGISSNEQFQANVLPQLNALEDFCLVQFFNDGFMDFDETYIYQLAEQGKGCPLAQETT